MKITITQSGRVCCETEMYLPLSASVAWGQLRDFQRFSSVDYFHINPRVERGRVQAGARLEMDHRFGPFFVIRAGRILRWCEWSEAGPPAGFAISDLSLHGSRTGFPHTISFRLRDERLGCSLRINVGGLWTARWIPRWMARLWLRWVFSHIVSRARSELLAHALWRQDRLTTRI